jgi:DNA-binding transcriptional regulator YbjK
VPTRPATHRGATLHRRDALLDAAVALVAERGVQGLTHRAVAARAGLPPSTPSYFFATLNDLVVAALQRSSTRQTGELDAVTAALLEDGLRPEDAVDRLVSLLVAEPAAQVVAHFEAYLEVSRRDGLRPEVAAVLAAYERMAAAALGAAGADPAAGRAFVALVDGFALQRLVDGRPDPDALRGALLALLRGLAG